MSDQAATKAATANSLLLGDPRDLLDRIDFVEYWRNLTHRKWAILAFAFAVTVLTAVVVMVLTPIYSATVTILIEPNKQKVVSSIEDVYSSVGASREHYQTQVEVIKSREVAIKAIQKLKLYDHPDFDPRQPKKGVSAFLESIGFSTAKQPDKWTPDELANAIVVSFSRQLSIEPVRLSQLVKISFESADPALAANVANAVAAAYIESDLDARYQMTRDASTWLQARLTGLKEKLAQSEEALQSYREKKGLADIKGASQSGEGNTIQALTMQLVNARAQRAQAENAYKLIKNATDSNTLGSLPTVQRSLVVAEAKKQESEAERKMSDIMQRYGKLHPKYVQAEGEVNTARDNVKRQINVVVAGVLQEFEAAKGTERALEATLASARSSIVSLNRQEFGLTSLERDVESNRSMYDMFIKRAKETTVAGDLQSTVARVIDPAALPTVPVRPKKTLTVAVALVLGLLGGAMIALLIEMLDNTFKSSEGVEARLHKPILAVLPLLGANDLDRTVSGTQILAKPNSLYSEAVRTARTGVMLSSVDSSKRVLLITSSIPGEGKTTFAVNLALASAQNKKTLLIDADMRRPSVGKAFGREPSLPGLSDLVAGSAKFSECSFRLPDSELVIMPSGPVPPNPLELLHSDKFREALAKLKEHFDIIIIDSPPVELVSDALVIADQATGVLFMTRAMMTPYPLARRATLRIARANGHVMGVVLNALDFAKAEKYFGEYSGYSHKYSAYGYQGGYGTSYGHVPSGPDQKA